jgi:hypothetical protein
VRIWSLLSPLEMMILFSWMVDPRVEFKQGSPD